MKSSSLANGGAITAEDGIGLLLSPVLGLNSRVILQRLNRLTSIFILMRENIAGKYNTNPDLMLIYLFFTCDIYLRFSTDSVREKFRQIFIFIKG